MRLLKELFLFTLLLMLQAGCSDDLGLSDDTQAVELISTKWVLRSIDVPDSQDIEVDTNKSFSIQFFEDLHLSGINDCNDYFGVYKISDNSSLSLDSLISTAVGCGESIDREYSRALHSVYSYEISNNMLRLYYDENNSSLNYIKAE